MATSWRCGEFSGDDAVDSKGTEERGGGGKEEGGKSRHSLTDDGGRRPFQPNGGRDGRARDRLVGGRHGGDGGDDALEMGVLVDVVEEGVAEGAAVGTGVEPDELGRVAGGDEAEDGGRRTAV